MHIRPYSGIFKTSKKLKKFFEKFVREALIF